METRLLALTIPLASHLCRHHTSLLFLFDWPPNIIFRIAGIESFENQGAEVELSASLNATGTQRRGHSMKKEGRAGFVFQSKSPNCGNLLALLNPMISQGAHRRAAPFKITKYKKAGQFPPKRLKYPSSSDSELSGNTVRVKYVKQISRTDFSVQTSYGFC